MKTEIIPEVSHQRLDHDTDVARLDLWREQKSGIPEVVLGKGKISQDIIESLSVLALKKGLAMATKVSRACLKMASRRTRSDLEFEAHSRSRVIAAKRSDYIEQQPKGCVGILAAGTADVGIAEEARITLEVLGCRSVVAYDVGVACIHRLIKPLEDMKASRCQVIIVVAGMEGALALVVKGLAPVPVIGVPTSVGYGYGGGGQAALMGMLQSCSYGLTVVNIDNGFGAAGLIGFEVRC